MPIPHHHSIVEDSRDFFGNSEIRMTNRTLPTFNILFSVDGGPAIAAGTYENDVAALAESIAMAGMFHPILVEPSGAPDTYRVIAGDKRLAAARELEWETIYATVVECDNPTVNVSAYIRTAENAMRSTNHAAEFAAVSHMRRAGRSVDEIRARLPIPAVRNLWYMVVCESEMGRYLCEGLLQRNVPFATTKGIVNLMTPLLTQLDGTVARSVVFRLADRIVSVLTHQNIAMQLWRTEIHPWLVANTVNSTTRRTNTTVNDVANRLPGFVEAAMVSYATQQRERRIRENRQREEQTADLFAADGSGNTTPAAVEAATPTAWWREGPRQEEASVPVRVMRGIDGWHSTMRLLEVVESTLPSDNLEFSDSVASDIAVIMTRITSHLLRSGAQLAIPLPTTP